MKRHSLLSLFFLGTLVAGYCEEPGGKPDVKSDPPSQASAPKARDGGRSTDAVAIFGSSRVEADGTLHLSAGRLTDVVAQIEQCLPELNKQGKTDWSMPNVIFDEETATRDAAVPANLRLRKVTPVQALALVAAAAGCTLETIFAPAEIPPARGVDPTPGVDPTTTTSSTVIGYRIVQPANKTASGEIGGIGITLVKKGGKTTVGEVLPGSPADRSSAIKPGDLILSVGENRSKHVLVADMPLEEVAERLRGTPGSPVELDLQSAQPGKGKTQVGLVREKLNWPAPKPTIGVREMPVQIINSSGGEVMGAKPASHGPFLLIDGAESGMVHGMTPPAGQSYGPFGSTLAPRKDSEPVVRVYATGSVFSGSEKESAEKQQEFINLVREALQIAGIKNAKSDPIEAIHERSKALIVKGTATEHALIEQIIAVLKENEAEAAAGKTTER